MGKGQQQPQQQGGGDNSLDFVWMIAGTIVAVGLSWYFGKQYIVPVIYYIRLGEIWLIEAVLHGVSSLASALSISLPPDAVLERWKSFMHLKLRVGDLRATDFGTIRKLSNDVGFYIAYPALIVQIGMGIILYINDVASKYKRVYNMKNLRRAEVNTWPQLKSIADLNLTETPIDDMPWAMSEQPIPFARKHGLVKQIQKRDGPGLEVLPGRAYRQFALQMGPLWVGLEELPPHMQALFAIFAAQGNNDGDSARKLLRQIAMSANALKAGKVKQLNYSGVRRLLVKHVRHRSVGRAVSMHAYTYTVLASMLELARTGGVLATAEFLWLKPVDRQLWYMLNAVGRNVAFIEIAGPFAHWLVEKRLRRPLKVPMVGEAIVALVTAVEETKFNAETM